MLPIKNNHARPGIAAAKKYPASSLGFMLFEVLISILLFALAFVVLMDMQVRSIADTGQTQYRAEAIHLANAYVARMWAHRGNGEELASRFQSGEEYQALGEEVKLLLPNAQAPVVVINDSSYTLNTINGNTYELKGINVRVSIFWQELMPTGELQAHNYTHVTSIGYPALASDQ